MGPKRMQLLTCALLAAGGAGLMALGYFMGGIAAVGVGGVLAVVTLGKPSR
jgi:hypothetical protein